jgi:hypothetical protein
MKNDKNYASNLNMQSAVILGNGPSLKGFDFISELREFDTFGMNAAYRYWHKIKWYPKYYSCMDSTIVMSHQNEIIRLIMQANEFGIQNFLLPLDFIHLFNADVKSHSILNFQSWCIRNKIQSLHCVKHGTTGSLTLLWTASLGYKNIILLGIDLNFIDNNTDKNIHIEKLNDNSEYKNNINLAICTIKLTPKSNPNYFFNDYQQAGDKYGIALNQNLYHLKAWEDIDVIMKKMNINVINANEKSQLDIFPKMTWEEAKNQFYNS